MQDEETLRSANWPRIQRTLLQLQQVYPTNTTVLTALGFASIRLGAVEDACRYFDEAVQTAPGNPDYWHNLGLACRDADRLAEAEACFKEALQLDSNQVAVLKSLSSLYWHLEDYQAARPLFIRLQALEPGNPEHTQWLNRISQQLDRRATETP